MTSHKYKGDVPKCNVWLSCNVQEGTLHMKAVHASWWLAVDISYDKAQTNKRDFEVLYGW